MLGALLSVPLLMAACAESTPTKSTSGATAPAPATSKSGATAPAPKNGGTAPTGDTPAKADPPPPAEPMGEIYGTPEMIDRRLGGPLAAEPIDEPAKQRAEVPSKAPPK